MKKVTIFALITSLFVSTFSIANEVNVFNARHYKADAELYSKFTNLTGIKVNLINGIILTGKIIKYDNFSLLIDISNRPNLIYKHAISHVSFKKKNKK